MSTPRAIEIAQLRQAIPLSDEELAAVLKVPASAVADWTTGRVPARMRELSRLRTLSASYRDQELLARSGLPTCDWITQRSATGSLDTTSAYRELASHVRSCDVCRARKAFLRINSVRGRRQRWADRMIDVFGRTDAQIGVAVWVVLVIEACARGMLLDPVVLPLLIAPIAVAGYLFRPR